MFQPVHVRPVSEGGFARRAGGKYSDDGSGVFERSAQDDPEDGRRPASEAEVPIDNREKDGVIDCREEVDCPPALSVMSCTRRMGRIGRGWKLSKVEDPKAEGLEDRITRGQNHSRGVVVERAELTRTGPEASWEGSPRRWQSLEAWKRGGGVPLPLRFGWSGSSGWNGRWWAGVISRTY